MACIIQVLLPCVFLCIRSSGLRVGCDGNDHQFCKKLTTGMLPSAKRMLDEVPAVREAWGHIRKSYDGEEQFTERQAALSLSIDLGFANDTSPSSSVTTRQPSSNTHDDGEQEGWYCFSCPKSNIVQPFSQKTCVHCGKIPDWVKPPNN